MDKETIVNSYKAIGRSVVNYAAPIWTTFLSDTQWNRLQVSQNNALRTATGCHQMAHPDHLHQETLVLPIRKHNELLAKQFLLKCHNPEHVSHEKVIRPPPHRAIRNDLRFYNEDVSLFVPEIWDPESTRLALDALHQQAVQQAKLNFAPNAVLNEQPPPVHKSEETLPRETRATLAQLRSGYSNFLASYKARIAENIQDVCPNCNDSPHNTQQIFNCQACPTTLTVTDLWSRPTETASFLGLKI